MWIALLLVAALVVPVGGWLVDELDFRSSGDAVADELGDDADLVGAMLLVRSVGCDGRTSTGSAFALDVDGAVVVVTNRHVVEGARRVSVRSLLGGPLEPAEGYRVASDVDVAVLEFADAPVDRVLPPARDAHAGQEVRVIGFPAGRPSTGAGLVRDAVPGRLVVEVPVSGGASGSPVLDDTGSVVGQIHATTARGHGVATPIAALVGSLGDLTTPGPC